MRNIMQFSISKSEGLYVAEAMEFPIVTQARTFEELTANIREAVEVYLHDEDTNNLDITKTPSLLINFEIPVYA